jgi:hypothetical protein
MRGVTPLAEAALTSAPPSKRARTLARRAVRAASRRLGLGGRASTEAPTAEVVRIRKAARGIFIACRLSPGISYSNVLNRFLKPLS